MGRPRISFNTIIPKKGFLFNIFAFEIQRAMRFRVKPALRKMFYRTVDTWDTPVYFRGTIRTIAGKSIRLLVKPYGSGKDLYELVARGSPRHPIPKHPKTDGYLKFQIGYISATEPGWIGSRRKQRFGDTVYTRWVPDHPGFEARNFDVEIAIKYADKFEEEMRKAVDRYVEKQERAFRAIRESPDYKPVERR